MANRRTVHIYFGSHKDCFVHGVTREWNSWLKTSQDNLNIISLSMVNGFKVFATFSPNPVLFSGKNKKAKHLQPPEYYVEIDPDYAQCLGIKEGDKATIECIPDVTKCLSMTVESTSQDDYEVLEQNKEMIVFQMLDQVRIISCQRSFAIWINQQPIFFKLVKSEPPATWVLIGNKTFVDIKTSEPNTMLSPSSFPTSPLPGRADSQDSDESGQTGSTANSYFSSLSHQSKQPRVHTVEPNKGTGGKMKEPVKKRFSHSDATLLGETLCFPKEDEFHDSPESMSIEEGSMVERLLNYMNLNTLFRGNSPNEEDGGLLGSQSGSKQNPPKIPFLAQRGEPQKKKISMSHSFTYGAKGKHSKQPSWHGRTEYELEKEQYVRSIAMPIMLNPIQVRVQELNLDKLKAVWDIHEYNEVFVHPSTLPDLFQMSKGGTESYLVSLSFASGSKNGKDTKPTGSAPQSTTPTPSPFPKQALSSHLPEKPKKDDQGVMNMMTQLSRYEDTVPSITFTPPTPAVPHNPAGAHQHPPTQPRPQSPTANSVICQLQFATVIRFNNRRKKSASLTLEEVSISREGSSSPTTGTHPSPSRQPRVMGCVSVLPNHIVMSDLMRQQLGVKPGSVVRLAGCHENWRVNCRYNRVSLFLHPIATKKSSEQSALGSGNEGRKKSDIIRAFKNWVGKFEESPYGCVFASNMVIPLNINLSRGGAALISCSSEEVLLCKVTAKIDKQPARSNASVDSPQIFTITVNDLRKDAIKESMHHGIEIIPVIDKPEDSTGAATTLGANNIPKQTTDLPPLEELAPPKLVESLNQFGGMDELFSAGYDSLTSLLEHTPGGAMLICGVGGGGGVGGCGKTSLARLLCKALMESHHKAHVKIESCTLFRGKRYESIQKKFKDILNEVIHCQPCVILLDDLDNCAQNITDVQKEATGEGIMHLRNAQNFINILRQRAIKAVVIATATNKDLLHTSLLHSKGKHVFSDTIEIPPPNMNIRQKILEAILHNMNTASVLSESELRTICLKTEGYQAIDIKVLVSRAIRNAEQRHFLARIENQISSNSLSTVGSVSTSSSHQVSVGLNDFLVPLNSYVPASLSGLSLHKSGHTNFKSVGGLEEAKTTLQETLLWPSKYPRLFKACPIKQHAGILLYGAPGTGKTLLAGAVANEFGLNFVSIKGPELLNKFIGASEQSVRDLFTRAQAARPCILFFDEFDSLAPRRGHDRTGVTDRVVNQILTQLDGVEALEGVYVLAASSRPDLIDPALLRPGRIDRILLCNMPTETDRELILKALSRNLPLSLDIDFKVIALKTQNYTGADLKALLYNAQLLQVRRTLESKNSKLTSSPTFQDNRTSSNNDDELATIAATGTSSTGTDKLQTHSIKSTQSGSASNPSNNNTKDHSTSGKVWQFNYKKQAVAMETTAFREHSQRHSTSDKLSQRDRVKCLVSQEDLLTALASTKPSLSETERKKYEKINEKFLGKSKTNITDLDQRATLA